MFPTDTTTWILYILLTVVLGAISSGLWEKIFKPLFSMCARFILRASTFGIVTARDGIYKEIARRSPNKPVLFLIFLLTIGSTALLGGASYIYSRTHISEELAIKEQQDKDKLKESYSKMSKEQLIEAKLTIDAKLRNIERERANLYLLGAIWLFIVCGYSYSRYSYISSAISYFDQCLAICSPYFSPEDRTKVVANYAAIQSRQDYLQLIQSLKEVAKANNFALPEFMPL